MKRDIQAMGRDFGVESEFVAEVRAARKMPTQKPGKSIQTYATPFEFIAAVKARFKIRGFAYDLAASAENTKAAQYFTEEQDSLTQYWGKLRGPLWLNPPYAHIAPWAQKCAESALPGGSNGPSLRQIYFLVPAAVGANWFAQHVHKKALVLLLNGRISFDGKAPYPKDCLLAVFGVKPGYEVWRWKDGDR